MDACSRASRASQAAPLWFLAQLAFNASLLYTSVTSNTILSSASSLFTFVLSVLLLGERYTFPKLVCVGACMAGGGRPGHRPASTACMHMCALPVHACMPAAATALHRSPAPQPMSCPVHAGTVLVTVADGAAPAPQGDALVRVLGDTLTLVSAALYAGYTVSLRKDLPGEESAQQVALFFGWIGVYSIAMATPLLLGALAMGWVELGSISGRTYGIIFGEGAARHARPALTVQARARARAMIATFWRAAQVPTQPGRLGSPSQQCIAVMHACM